MKTADISRKTRSGIDSMKLICAVLVVVLHATPLKGYNDTLNYYLVNWLCRIAVPFFFMCTGFFVIGGEIPDKKYIASYCGKILALYIVWTGIYLPLNIYNIIKTDTSVGISLLKFFMDFFFAGSYRQLWYLPATVVAVWLASFFIRKYGVKITLKVSAVLYFIGLIPQSYAGAFPFMWENQLADVLKFIFTSTRNGVFMGFLFVTLGGVSASGSLRLSHRTAFISFAFSELLFLVEVAVLKKLGWSLEKDMFVFLVPSTFFLFNAVKSITLYDETVSIKLRFYSTALYLTHMWSAMFFDIICKFLKYFIVLPALYDYAIRGIGILFISFVISFIMLKIQDTPVGRLLMARKGSRISNALIGKCTALMLKTMTD